MVRVLPPGSDLTGQEGSSLLAGVDQLVDGIHVSVSDVGLKAAGRKAVARSLSDIAAMCGRPLATLVSAVVPKGMSGQEAMELFDSMKATRAISENVTIFIEKMRPLPPNPPGNN